MLFLNLNHMGKQSKWRTNNKPALQLHVRNVSCNQNCGSGAHCEAYYAHLGDSHKIVSLSCYSGSLQLSTNKQREGSLLRAFETAVMNRLFRTI